MNTSMKALRYEQTGSLDNLNLADVAPPTLAPGEALVQVKAAGINGSDSAGVQGWFPFVTVPRTAGRDFSGTVAQVHSDADSEWVGAEVWGTGGDRGFAVDGTYADYVKVPVSALSRKPKSLTHVQAGSLGLPWLCAWIAVETLAQVKKGENVLIIGARGGIGSAAAQLCADRGASVLGTYRTLPPSSSVPAYLTPIALSGPTAIRDAAKTAGFSNKIDVLLDCAGYEEPFNDAVGTMTPRGTGRVVVMAVHRPDGQFSMDLRAFYTRALTLKGLKSSMLDAREIKQVLDVLAQKFDSGAFEGPSEVRQVDMGDVGAVRAALREVTERSSAVRSVIVPGGGGE
ncbi:GroES-like protein [Coniophora puteana RWD-64-598 SS2]|uniref:GroES-like protein n=1 Tax=Coniophora puteana (strain RWD-64-598) TaxID=741705 RepID=R7SDE0_CONPW|nr:GroES-like protein [Coniophora puteana RWD-64-598 SS2]EIW74178.1 GroES-like protein [Coniophora puteana RWD-64-598 SS2]